MYMPNDTQAADTALADEQRTKRLFVGFLSGLLGVDQSYTGEDSAPASRTGTYQIANPDGTYSVLGQPVSSQNQNPISTITGISAEVLLLGAIALFLLNQ